MKRVVSQYSKESPYGQINEYHVSCEAEDMRHLFNIDDDLDMIFVYPIKTEEQIKFFKDQGVPIDLTDGFFYVEAYEE